MIARLRPAGAVLAAVAAWAVGLLLLALAGLGGRVGLHPGNAALAPPVPQVRLEAVDSRLGPATDYAEVGNRPLLNADRRPAAVSAAGDSEAPLDWVLSGVLLAGDFKAALLQSPTPSLEDFSALYGSSGSIRARHYELWFAPGAIVMPAHKG